MHDLDLEEFCAGSGRKLERAVAVGAHPDDVEFSAGGTVARLVDAGVVVTLVVCTDGARGGSERADMTAVRHGEQDRAARELGVESIRRIGRRDGELVCDEALRGAMVRVVREARPQLVMTHDPTTILRRFGSRTFLGHTDHRATGQAVLDAIYPRSGNPNFFPEQLDEPGVALYAPSHLWLFDTAAPDTRVDIGATLARKLAALAAHESQQQAAGGLTAAAEKQAFNEGDRRFPAETFQVHRLRG